MVLVLRGVSEWVVVDEGPRIHIKISGNPTGERALPSPGRLLRGRAGLPLEMLADPVLASRIDKTRENRGKQSSEQNNADT